MNTQIPLAYTRTGTKPILVLIHGFPLERTIWDDVLPLLEDDFELIVPDLRGFGDSETVDQPYTMVDMADDIIALLDKLGVERAFFAGHSMGGYVALALAVKYMERVRGLGLVSTQAAADNAAGKQGRYDTAETVAADGIGVVVEAMAPKLAIGEKVQEAAREIMERQTPAAVIGGLKAMAERDDLRSALSYFDFPLVIVHGNADAILPIDLAHKSRELAEDAQLIEVTAAGHLPMMENPKATAAGLKMLL